MPTPSIPTTTFLELRLVSNCTITMAYVKSDGAITLHRDLG